MALSAGYLAGQVKDNRAEVALQAAIKKEVVDGDLKTAIEQYKKLAQDRDQAVAAKALLRMGQCYEKLGSTEARKAYERAVREFGDQKEAVATAQARLAALGGVEKDVVARKVWSAPSTDSDIRVSPNGQAFVFRDPETQGVSLRSFSTGEVRRLTHKDGQSTPPEVAEMFAFSNDGRQIAYSWYTKEGLRELRLIGSDGSNPRVLLQASKTLVYPESWSPDGRSIVVDRWPGVSGPKDMALVRVDDGSITVVSSQRSVGAGRLSPDGRYIVCAGKKPSSSDSDIFLIPTDGSREIVLVEGKSSVQSPVWSPDGSRVYFVSDRSSSNDLWFVPVVNGQAGGEPQLVHKGIGNAIMFARDGTLYSTVLVATGDVYVADLDPATGLLNGAPRRQTQVSINRTPVWSPDGQAMAYLSRCLPQFFINDRLALVVRRQDGTEKIFEGRFQSSCAVYGSLQWFPDGRSLLVRDRFGLLAIDADTGQTREAFPKVTQQQPLPMRAILLARDGRFLYYPAPTQGSGSVGRRDTETGADREVVRTEGDNALWGLSLSPDERLLAYWDGPRVRVVSVDGGTARDLFRPRPGICFDSLAATTWSADGRFVYFTAAEGENEKDRTTALWRVPASGGEPQRVLAIPGESILAPNVHPSGKQIAFSTTQTRTEVWALSNLLPAK